MNRAIAVPLAGVLLLSLLLRGVSDEASGLPHREEGVGALPVGPAGVIYENCTAEQQAALETALAGIHDKKTVHCKDKIGADLLKCLLRKEENIIIKCGGGACDEDPTVEGAAPLNGNYVRICTQTFGNPQRLEAVLFHEMVHSCGWNAQDKVAEACQNACYAGQGATPPSAGEEGGSCDGTGSALATTPTLITSPQNLNLLEGAITSDESIYAYGEPITITFQLQNVGATGAITVNKSWYNPNVNSLAIFDSQGQQRESLVLWETRPPDMANFAVLGSPGAVFTDTFAIREEFYGTLAPGFYTLTVTYTNWYTGHFSPLYPYPFSGDIGAWTGTLRTNDLRIFVYLQRVFLPVVLKNYGG